MCDSFSELQDELDEQDLLNILPTVCDCPACGMEVLVTTKENELDTCPNCGQVFAFRNVFFNELSMHEGKNDANEIDGLETSESADSGQQPTDEDL